MAQIKIPKRFFEDHSERDLPTPAVLRETKAYLVIDTADEAFPELVDDAKHYANDGVDMGPITAARALLKAIDRQTANPA